MIINLEVDNCCWGGHCGPVPGYYYKCPICNEETDAKAFFQLKVGDVLKCNTCGGVIEAVEKIDDLTFEFQEID